MHIERMLNAVDSHTEGMPTRVVTGGLPPVPGASMYARQGYFRDHLDHLRRTLVFEPRGHSVMVAALLVPPVDPEAHLGVLFGDEMGYLPMCGHGVIGVCTVATETGLIPAGDGPSRVVLDTPAGRVEACVDPGDETRDKSVTLTNIPSFLARQDAVVQVEGIGAVTLDIAYGGNFFAILPADAVGLSLVPANAQALVNAGMRIMAALEEQVAVQHPENPAINEIKHVLFTGPASDQAADARNATVIHPGMLDRSPCGTGTSARMAQRWARGEFELDTDFVHESIIGTRFTGRLVATQPLSDGTPAVRPTIRGRAWIHSLQQIVVDPDDPFPGGFTLR